MLGELCRDSRAAAASAYCCSSLMISGLSGDMGRVSSSVLGSCGDEALCLPLLVDSSDELWEPGNKEMEEVRKTTLEKNLGAERQQQKGRWGGSWGDCGACSEHRHDGTWPRNTTPDTQVGKHVSKPHIALTSPYLRQLFDGLHCPLASQWSGWQKSAHRWSGYTSLEQRQNNFIHPESRSL